MNQIPVSPTKPSSKIKLFLIIVIFFLAVFGGRTYFLANQKNASNPPQNLIGGNKDSHGCLIGAGYTWCQVKNKCLRIWEEYCTKTLPKTAVFTCSKLKSITATFYPKDDKFVDLILSDGRKLSVPHAISASGARYARSDEIFVFWNKGNTAFITESGKTTFENCITSNQ